VTHQAGPHTWHAGKIMQKKNKNKTLHVPVKLKLGQHWYSVVRQQFTKRSMTLFHSKND
jgi:hypothetical protein